MKPEISWEDFGKEAGGQEFIVTGIYEAPPSTDEYLASLLGANSRKIEMRNMGKYDIDGHTEGETVYRKVWDEEQRAYVGQLVFNMVIDERRKVRLWWFKRLWRRIKWALRRGR